MKHKLCTWITGLGCVACGILFSCLLLALPEYYRGDFQILPIRIIFLIGPLGWLLFSLLAAFFVLRVPRANLASILVICFLSALMLAECVLIFAPISYPPFRASPSTALEPPLTKASVSLHF